MIFTELVPTSMAATMRGAVAVISFVLSARLARSRGLLRFCEVGVQAAPALCCPCRRAIPRLPRRLGCVAADRKGSAVATVWYRRLRQGPAAAEACSLEAGAAVRVAVGGDSIARQGREEWPRSPEMPRAQPAVKVWPDGEERPRGAS